MVWSVRGLLPCSLALALLLAGCASAEKQKACLDSCEQRFARDLDNCNKFSSHEANTRARERLLVACLKGEKWPNGQQDCRERCTR